MQGCFCVKGRFKTPRLGCSQQGTFAAHLSDLRLHGRGLGSIAFAAPDNHQALMAVKGQLMSLGERDQALVAVSGQMEQVRCRVGVSGGMAISNRTPPAAQPLGLARSPIGGCLGGDPFRSDQAAVGETGTLGRRVVTLKHRDIVAVFRQFVCRGHAHHAGANHRQPQGIAPDVGFNEAGEVGRSGGWRAGMEG